ncbi:MAG TPA: hypothetical protein VMG12_41205 [Polyangiaceae bacterium]|nr:hypothetical protein [Polyangiaceae bacterium]
MPRFIRCAALLGAVWTSVGCGAGDDDTVDDDGTVPPPGGQTGEETLGCRAVERQMLAWSELSSLGFSADNLLNTLGSESAARLSWSNGGGTSLTLGVERASARVEFQSREFTSNSSGAEPAAEIGIDCKDVVAVPVTLSFSTADGAFAEAWPLTLLADSATHVNTSVRLDPNDVAGTFSVTQVDPNQYDDVRLFVDLTFADGAWTGSISGQANTADPSDPNGVAASHPFSIASF